MSAAHTRHNYQSIMKKIIVVTLLVLCCSTLSAQKNKYPNHRFGVAVDAGWSQLFMGSSFSLSDNIASPAWGWLGGGELAYELAYKHLLFRFAVEADYSRNWNRFDVPSLSSARADDPGTIYHYDFSNFKQRTSYGGLRIPLMAGVEIKSFYFLVGTKLGIGSFSSNTLSYVDAHIQTTDVNDINHDMGNFSFTGNKQTVKFDELSATASIELGLGFGGMTREFDKHATKEEIYKEMHRPWTFTECLHYKVALFADYGLTDMYEYQANPVAYQTDEGYNSVNGGLFDVRHANVVFPNSIFGYTANKDAIIHNLFVGLRFAIMYQKPPEPPTTGSWANPHIIVFVTDGHTGEALKGAEVQMLGINPKNGRPQIVTKTTGGKFNNVERACFPGSYDFSVSYPGYLSFDTTGFQHGINFDTLFVRLYPPLNLKVNVVDAKTGRPIRSKITVQDIDGNDIKKMALDSGKTDTMILSSERTYRYYVTSEGYYDTSYTTTLDISDLTIAMTPIPPRKFVLKAMYFATDSTEVLPLSEGALGELYTFLSDNPEVRIRIIGHTDDVASDEYNQELSEGRANSVKAEMVRRGIDADRIETMGRGESEPIVPNDSDSNRQMNRRVEIELLSGNVRIELLREL